MDLSLEAIKHRSSVRSFDGKPLDPAEVLALEMAFDECVPGPFGGRARFVLVSASATGFGESADGGHSRTGKIGTYGLVTKVPAFLVGAIKKAPRALEDFGYAMEGLVLRASDLGLESCWIGGAFARNATAKAIELCDDEFMPAIIAVGRPAQKPTVVEFLTRVAARAGTRKPSESLFFEEGFVSPLVIGEPWSDALEALRIGPSASNKQPWRIVKSGSEANPAFHLYLEEDKIYNSILGEVHLQNVDMGIAMRHLESAAHALDLPGAWTRLESDPFSAAAPLFYIATWASSPS
jgi:nitroreductase